MRILLPVTALFALCALPCMAEDYYSLMATAKEGNGYVPATIVAGSAKLATYSVLSFVPDGDRLADAKISGEWKAVLVTASKIAPQDDDYDDDRYQDRKATTPKAPVMPTGPIEPRREVVYSSRTCPAVMAQMAALKTLTSFEFDPPELKGNQDGPNGDGHQGFDLWIRAGDAELTKSAETPQSKLGAWFQQTTTALAACPAAPKPAP